MCGQEPANAARVSRRWCHMATRRHHRERPRISLPEPITTSSLSNGAAPSCSSRFSKKYKPPTGSTSFSKQSETASAERLVDMVRRLALPKMQGVVNDLPRSITSMRRSNNKPSSSRFNVNVKQGTSGLSAGSYTRFANEDGDEASEGRS